MAKLIEIGVFSFAKLQAVLMAWLGLSAGILYSVGGAVYDVFTTGLNPGTALAFYALIAMPLTLASFGFTAGVIQAFLYNLAARWVGGVEVDLES